MNKNGIILTLFVGFLALFAVPALAIDIPTSILPECIGAPGGCNLCDIWPLANNIINMLLFAFAIPLLTVMIIWGGVMWTTAGASPSNIEQGKKIIQSAIIGILIAFSAWLIVDTIIKSLASGGSVIGAWQEFPDQARCENPALADEQFTFDQLIPGAGVTDTTTTPVVGGDTKEEAVRSRLLASDIQVNKGKCNPYDANFTLVAGGCTNVGGLKEVTIQEIIRIQDETNATVYITGGSEMGHSCTAGKPSHCTGNKVDFRIGIPQMDDYIRTTFQALCSSSAQCSSAVGRGDISAAYKRPSTNIIYYQEGDHWDVLVP